MLSLHTHAIYMKDFNLSHHYNTLHKVKYEKYTAVARAAIVADLKSKVHNSDFSPEPQPHRKPVRWGS